MQATPATFFELTSEIRCKKFNKNSCGFLGGRLHSRNIREVVRDKGRRLLIPVVSFGILWDLLNIPDAPWRIVGF